MEILGRECMQVVGRLGGGVRLAVFFVAGLVNLAIAWQLTMGFGLAEFVGEAIAIYTGDRPGAAQPRVSNAILAFAWLSGLLGLAVVAGAAILWQGRRNRGLRAEREAESEHARGVFERFASTDDLTGTMNRRGLSAFYDARRELLSEHDLVITLLMIDVDGMRLINDAGGREAGDMLLVRLAELLRSVVRREDGVGRVDGDAFLLVLSAPRYSRAGEAVAERLQQAAAARPELRCLGGPVSLSIGITRVSCAETTFGQALGEAELALRAAKDAGAGRTVAYAPALGDAHERRSSVLRDVAAALEAGRIVPAYQPIVALKDRRIVAYEVLARLRAPDGTLIEAARLAPALEDPQLATRISERVLAQAIRDAGALRREGLEFGRLAVNATEPQLVDPDFAERLLDELMLEGLSPEELALELTEQVLLSRREAQILATLESLARAGVALAFDDFGTGYASLSHLRRYPVGCLKLEQSFVGEIAADPAVREISTAVFDLAGALKRRVVAEGVETAAVDALLRELGCDCAQGFYYCPPVPLSEVRKLARRGLAA